MKLKSFPLKRMFGVSALLFFLVSCTRAPEPPTSQHNSESSLGEVKSAPIVQSATVVTAKPEYREYVESFQAQGTITAKQTSNIGPLAEGIVEKINVKVGDRVTRGKVLFQTRQINYRLRLEEAQAQLELAHATWEEAKTLMERYRPLVPDGAVAEITFDKAVRDERVAKANVDLARTQLSAADQALKDTLVRAPFNGAITMRYIDEGVYMTNRFSGMGNSAVVQLQECEIAAAILFAPEARLNTLSLGQIGTLEISGTMDPIEAEITILNDRVDPAARTVEFRMPFKNPDCRVKAGQSVTASLRAKPTSILVLPRAAIHDGNGDRFVYRVENGKALKTSIQTKDLDLDWVRVISGLNDQDKVVTQSSLPLEHNLEVTESHAP